MPGTLGAAAVRVIPACPMRSACGTALLVIGRSCEAVDVPLFDLESAPRHVCLKACSVQSGWPATNQAKKGANLNERAKLLLCAMVAKQGT